MAYDVFITFGGLCFFKHKRPDGRMHVLMPDTTGHEQHLARLGYHVRYEEDVVSEHGVRFREHLLPAGALNLAGFITTSTALAEEDAVSRNLRGLHVVDISHIAGKDADPARADGEVLIHAGDVCASTLCEHGMGARWNLRKVPSGVPEGPQHAAISITWRIRNVTSMIGGLEGIRLPFPDDAGEEIILRPVNNQIRFYIFHTPMDDSPAAGPPVLERLCKGQMAHHFRAFFRLYDEPAAQADLEFVDDGHRTAGGDEKLLMFNFVGRRVTCAVGSGG